MRLVCAIILAVITFNVFAVNFSTIDLKHDIEYVDGVEIHDFAGANEPDIVLIGRNKERQKQLQLVTIKQGKLDENTSFITDLDANVLFYHKAKLANHDKQVMLFLLPDQIAYFDMETKSLKTLIQTQSIYRNSHALTYNISQLEFTHDINNDELTDLIIADFEQTYVYVQQKDGSFADAQALEMLAQRRVLFDTGAVYINAELMINDFNSDGENDIVYRFDNDLYVFLQTTKGQFATKPIVQNLGFKHPLDNRYDQFNEDQSNLTTHTFFGMNDLNADGLMDMVTQVTKSSGLLDKS